MASGRALNASGLRAESSGGRGLTIADLAQQIEGPELPQRFDAFVAAEQDQAVCSLAGRGGEWRLSLYRFDDGPVPRLVLVELDDQGAGREQQFLLEVGRLTARLIHDFKNQINGLKLYAAYLKKRFADQPEGLETAEKINQGLNNMKEQAALVTRLTRRIELNRELMEMGEFLKQAINDYQVLAEARGVKVRDEIEEPSAAVSIDAQQLRAALGSIITRAIESSPEGGVVSIRLQSQASGLRIEVGDEGGILSERQRETLFDFLTDERINNTSLNMALARRIIEQHGGQVSARAASGAGTVVQLKLPL
ncbi:MAG TPA: HAMP domain-containing sensor histidine kinase [Blastocatellia bacterium]|nr:HAMP domain-containing sensor histidine kinase [Blastocatellia bacterium]